MADDVLELLRKPAAKPRLGVTTTPAPMITPPATAEEKTTIADENAAKNTTIVVKRIKKVHGGHHGGAWKIAYADFVTAMMAFFLLMWLLASLNKYQLKGIAQYFKTPLSELTVKAVVTGNPVERLPGGGQSNVQNTGAPEVEIREVESKTETPSEKALREAMAAAAIKENKQLESLKKELEDKINSDPEFKKFHSQLNMELTKDGLRVELRDVENRPMFDQGSDHLKPDTKKVIELLGKELNSLPNQLLIIGHTDAKAYTGKKDYSNWELSAERANMTRRVLVAGGLDDNKVLRVEGVADRNPLDKNDPYSPINRRIDIMILKKASADKLFDKDKH